MDVLKYNLIEKAPCEKVKFWAKQHERDICFYLNSDGNVIINAMFGDGKSMWLSTETKETDIDVNTEIIKTIQATMDMPNSEWYAVECSKIYEAIRLNVSRRIAAAKLQVYLREDKYRDIFGTWHDYSENTAKDIAKSLSLFMGKVKEANVNPTYYLSILEDLKLKIYGFSTKEIGWHLNYSKVKPDIDRLENLQYLKICSDINVRNKYKDLENYANKLYNECQTLSR